MQGLAAFFAAHSEFRYQHFPGTDEEASVAQRIQDRLPAVVEMRKSVELQVVDVHVAIKLITGQYLENVHFAKQVLVLTPVGHVVQQIQSTRAKPWLGEIGRHGLPCGAEKVIGQIKLLIAVSVRKAVR